jgi:hypothetical protein
MAKVRAGIRPDLPELMDTTIALIIRWHGLVDPAGRYSLDSLFDELSLVDFKLTPKVGPQTLTAATDGRKGNGGDRCNLSEIG